MCWRQNEVQKIVSSAAGKFISNAHFTSANYWARHQTIDLLWPLIISTFQIKEITVISNVFLRVHMQLVLQTWREYVTCAFLLSCHSSLSSQLGSKIFHADFFVVYLCASFCMWKFDWYNGNRPIELERSWRPSETIFFSANCATLHHDHLLRFKWFNNDMTIFGFFLWRSSLMTSSNE